MRYPLVAAVAALILSTSLAVAQTQMQGVPTYSSENVARANCGSQTVVWMNTDPASHVYHFAGSKNYGKTKAGAYLCRDAADKVGRAAKNEKEPKPTSR